MRNLKPEPTYLTAEDTLQAGVKSFESAEKFRKKFRKEARRAKMAQQTKLLYEFDPFRVDARFADLLRRVGLQP